jgi:DNA polymerase III subunit chi
VSEIGFYHLLRVPLERALPRLLEKALAAGHRVVVLAGSEERVEALNAALWTYDDAAFLPHGSARDGHAAEQPIWLTAAPENPNGATLLALVDGAEPPELGPYARCLNLFDGNDDEAVARARQQWAALKAAGHALTYWQQTPSGGWEKKA